MNQRCDLHVDLSGRTAIVTGAARGIGRALAVAFATSGAQVLAVDLLDSVLTAPEGIEKNWHGYCANLSKPTDVSAMVDYCHARVGTPDTLINAAGISRPVRVSEMELEDWEATISVNLNSVFLCTRTVLAGMMERRFGSIISFSSALAQTGGESSAHYSASKAGIEGFSRSLAREVGQYGIRVNVIAPGAVETKMLELMPPSQKEKLINRLPLRRVGYPEDMIGAALLLASDAGSYITGQTIHVNGGLHMG